MEVAVRGVEASVLRAMMLKQRLFRKGARTVMWALERRTDHRVEAPVMTTTDEDGPAAPSL